MRLSFIIPVYNGQDYIVRCLDSICSLNISPENYEIIVVDDCSTDQTRSIVNGYITTHAQVRLLCQEQNHRQGAARNRGIRECNGEYISFIDADDYVLEGFELSYKLLMNNNIDMVYGYIEIERPLGLFTQKLSDVPCSIISGADFAEQHCSDGVFFYPPSYIYRRQFLLDSSLFFTENRFHEDRDWLANVLIHASTVLVNPNTIYHYSLNVFSTCHTLSYSAVFDHIASGIRHIRLSSSIQKDSPNLSALLYSLGHNEIYTSLRLRNLSKFPWRENRHLYDDQHLKPLLTDLTSLHDQLPWEVKTAIRLPIVTRIIVFFAYPIASFVRTILRFLRKQQ